MRFKDYAFFHATAGIYPEICIYQGLDINNAVKMRYY